MRVVNISKTEAGDYDITSPNCPHCGLAGLTETISSDALYALNRGATALATLPYSTPEERERFISGYCPDCWNTLFDFDGE